MPPTLPEPIPAQSQSWLAWAGERAQGIGQGAMTLATGAKDVVVRKGGPLLSGAAAKAGQVASLAYKASGAVYQLAPGGGITATLAAKAAALTLPSEKALQKKIDHYAENLDAITATSDLDPKAQAISHTPREFAKATALYGRAYLEHCFNHADSIDPEVRPEWVRHLIHQSSNDSQNTGFIGNAAKVFIKENPVVVQKVIELNLMKGFCTLFNHIKEMQAKDPNWLVHFTKDFLDSVYQEIEAGKLGKSLSEKESADLEKQSGEAFVKTFSDAILKIAFPNGAQDLELLSSTLNPLKSILFKLVQEGILPGVLDGLYKDATSDYTRDYLVNQAVKAMKNFFETGNLQGLEQAKAPEKAGKRAPHVKPQEEEAFGESCALGASTMLRTLDPDLAAIAVKQNVGGLLIANRKPIIESLQSVDLVQTANALIHDAMPLIFVGGKQKNDQFQISEPIQFDKTIADREKRKQEFDKQQALMVKETVTIVESITHKLDGLYGAIATAVVGTIKKNPIGFKEKMGAFFGSICHFFIQKMVKFAFWLNYKPVFRATIDQAHNYARDLSIGRVGAPARSVITKRAQQK